MPDGWWLLLGGSAGLLGFANLKAARHRRTPGPGSLLLSCIAGYVAYLHGSWLWDDEQTRVVAAALVFCPASLVLGFLWWGTEGAFGRALIRLAAALGLGVFGFFFASTFLHDLTDALRFGLLSGALAFLPWRSFRRRQRERQARRHLQQEERRRRETERQEAKALQQEEQQQNELLQALMVELRK